jgi:hypothetical protein
VAAEVGRALDPVEDRRRSGVWPGLETGSAPQGGCFLAVDVGKVGSGPAWRCASGRWTEWGAHRLLQVRTQVLNEDLRTTFHRWYPGMMADPEPAEDAAA